VLYTAVLESPPAFRLVSNIGMRRPLYSTAFGKALLAFAPDEKKAHLFSSNFQALTPYTLTSLMQLKSEPENVRCQGYALDNEENVMGGPVHRRAHPERERRSRGSPQFVRSHHPYQHGENWNIRGSGEGRGRRNRRTPWLSPSRPQPFAARAVTCSSCCRLMAGHFPAPFR